MDANTIIQAATPFIVFLAVAVAKLAKANIPGWIITVGLVPLFSVLVTVVTGIVFPGSPFWSQVVSGLLAVFIYEVKKQLTEG